MQLCSSHPPKVSRYSDDARLRIYIWTKKHCSLCAPCTLHIIEISFGFSHTKSEWQRCHHWMCGVSSCARWRLKRIVISRVCTRMDSAQSSTMTEKLIAFRDCNHITFEKSRFMNQCADWSSVISTLCGLLLFSKPNLNVLYIKYLKWSSSFQHCLDNSILQLK